MKKVTAILIGAGHVYSQYALDHPDEFQVVAVAEPDKERREIFAAKHHIPEELCFKSYEEILAKEKMADCAMVCTQDQMHYEPVVMAMEKGYHVLCEKPMSPDKEEIIKIVSKLLKRYSLKLNNNKTRNYNINVVNHIKITGINIVVKENGKRTLSVGKKIKNNLFWCAINLYKDKNSNKDYQKQSLRIKGLNSFILSIEKNGYEDCYSEKMKNIIIKLGFENLQDLIKNL